MYFTKESIKETIMSTQKYTGSCHCKKIEYEASLDLSKGSSRCNCSFCSKVRNWSTIIAPIAFQYLSGEIELSHYKFRPDSPFKHFFCKTCGVRILSQGHSKELGGDFISLSLPTLDHVEPNTFEQIPIQFMDGLYNQWQASPKVTKYL
jgi:hypothetical protein